MSVYEYSSDYQPAAPVCEIYLGKPGHQARFGPLQALMDTGSDMTVIPVSYLRQVTAKRISRGQARSLWGASRQVDIYMVAFALNPLYISTLQVLADDYADEIIIGRGVLNRLKLVLDGPSATCHIVETI